MAEITNLEFEVGASVDINMLSLEVRPTIHFNQFDRNTNINYSLTFRVFGIDADGEPVELQSYEPEVVEATDTPRDSNGQHINDLTRSYFYGLDRAAADEDGPGEIDELQVRVDLEPKLPQTSTFRSAVQEVELLRVGSKAAS